VPVFLDMVILLFAIAMAKDIPKDEGCRVACIRSGFDSGKSYKKGCVCFTYQESYYLFTHNRIDLSNLRTTSKIPDNKIISMEDE
jgi:hypothetical protein